MLGVSKSGYYDWLKRCDTPPAGRRLDTLELVAEIEAVHEEFACYGSPRVHQELLARHRKASVNRVARLMRANGIRARRGRVKSRPRAAPPSRRPEVVDLVRRRFVADRPNRLWCTDLTQIRTGEGWLYAAVILDVHSRVIVSWAVANAPKPDTALQALDAAIKARRPARGLIVHSDRGYQFTSWDWLGRLRSAGLQPSIGQVGTALDNAMMESWFSSFKNEAVYPYGMPSTRQHARRVLFNYIDFHNRRRLHSALGYQVPVIYETQQSKHPSV